MAKIEKIKFLLQYPFEGQPFSSYVRCVKETASCQWVALDSASGGYPYPTDIDSAQNFRNSEEAIKYANSFPGLKVVKVKVTHEWSE